MKNEKTITYSKKSIIDEVAEELNIYPSAITEVYNTIEKVINKHLLEVDDKNSLVTVKIFEGIKMEGKLVPEHYHAHPTLGMTKVPEKIKFNCKISRSYQESKNNEYEESRKMLKEYLKEREKYKEK